MTATRIPTYCALCISRCGCLATVDGDRLVKVEPDPDHPTGDAICIKAKTAPEFVHHPARLTTPLLRTKPKGSNDPGFRSIGWDEALDIAASKMRTIADADGPEAVAFAVTTPSGTAIADSFGWVHRLVHAFGSPNLVFATENCNWHKDYTPMLTWGAGIGMPDYDRSGLVLLWGFNPTATWLSQVEPIREAQRRGAKVVAVDPRRQGLARGADLWLGLRPGTDGALALGLANLLLTRGGADERFLRAYSDAPFLMRDDTDELLTGVELGDPDEAASPVVWDETTDGAVVCTRGTNPIAASLSGVHTVFVDGTPLSRRPVLDRLRRRCAEYSVERVAAITGLAGSDIEQLGDWLASSGPVSFFTWTGTAQHANATQTTRAINVLYALTGSLDAPGGNAWFGKPPVRDISGFEWVQATTASRTLGRDHRPLGPPRRGWITTRDLFRSIVTRDPYPVRALISFGGNFELTKPKTLYAEEALKDLDFFMMTELFETPTSREADLLLPAASAWERTGLQAGFAVNPEADQWLQLRPAVVPPRGESRSDTEIVFQLADRLGLGECFFNGKIEDGLRHVLEPTGITLETLRANPRGIRVDVGDAIGDVRNQGFATASGRVELFASSLATIGEDPFPDVEPPEMSAEAHLDKTEFPLWLTSAKWPQFCHSQQRHDSSILRAMSHPLVQLHPETAATRGISQSDRIEVITPSGRIIAHAELTLTIRPDTVCSQYGWWDTEQRCVEANLSYNMAIDGDLIDRPSGSNAMRSYRCQVARIR